jgi:hypothetical protein
VALQVGGVSDEIVKYGHEFYMKARIFNQRRCSLLGYDAVNAM